MKSIRDFCLLLVEIKLKECKELIRLDKILSINLLFLKIDLF